MSSSARQSAAHEVPSDTSLELNASLLASLGGAADYSVASSRRYLADVGWDKVETYVDRAAPFKSRALREGCHNTLAAVVPRRAIGTVTPLLVIPDHLAEARPSLAAWQGLTWALITTPWTVVDAADPMALRRPAA